MSDIQWNTVASHLPKPAKTGRPRCNDRNTINGILFVLTTGCRWADMPDRYGSKSTAHLRFSGLRQKGIWKRILSGLIKSAHRQGKISLQKISVDSSSIPSKKGGTKQDMTGSRRSWAQKYTSQHTGLPIPIRASPANVHDNTKFIDVLENIPGPAGDGLIRQIISVYADKGYDAVYIRD